MSKRTCSIDGCEGPVSARGWCNKHYKRWNAYGSPTRERPKKVCGVEGCDSPHLANGYCQTHNYRNQAHGDPLAGRPSPNIHPHDALDKYTEVEGDCLVWVRGVDSNGYGAISYQGKRLAAHRVAWERLNGPIPTGMVLDHVCWTRRCVKVSHMRLATRAQNSAYRSSNGVTSATGFRNVYARSNGTFLVQVSKGGKALTFGAYKDISEAAEVAARARREAFGEFAGAGRVTEEGEK